MQPLGMGLEAARRAHARRARRWLVHGFDPDMDAYRFANLRDWASLLDLGCGGGEFLAGVRDLRHHQGMLVGLDRCPRQLERARSRLGERDITLVLADAMAPPLELESFDGVFLRVPLACGRDVAALISQVRRFVRPAGRLVIRAPSAANQKLSREFLRRLALELPELPPRRAAPSWLEAETATSVLAPILGPVETHAQNDAYHFRLPRDYLEYFDGMRALFAGPVSDEVWSRALARVELWSSAWFDTRHALSESASITYFVATVV
jgi:ubiquinone/menaquinone biosynthesis C-methylase UbiE